MNKNMLKMMLLALVASVSVASQAEAANMNYRRAQQVVVRVESHRNAHHVDRRHAEHHHDRCHAHRHAVCHCRACEERRRHLAHHHCHR